MTKKDVTRGGIDDRDIRLLLENKSPSDLARFLLKGARKNTAFRREVLAWLIQGDADALPNETVLGETGAWIEDVFDQRGVMPRIPNLRELNPVKSAVRDHPDPAVPVHLEIIRQIIEFLDAYGEGSTSLYDTLGSSYRVAAANLPRMSTTALRETYLGWMEEVAASCSDFGYGIDSVTAEVLDQVRGQVVSKTEGLGEGRRL